MTIDWNVERIAIVGVGLIGGSLARALKAACAVTEVIGIGRNEPNLRRAVELGVIDRFATDVEAGVEGADIVVIAT
ncbi:MAG: prephenate dehydrogenase/arogenate dehydrogenase family protein, partial [Gammaproteobacteria bacterium]|nr:prephenate dehydrogenase/arogenate dehydrogenase family protein [Gammaproteobacteria bacterium]